MSNVKSIVESVKKRLKNLGILGDSSQAFDSGGIPVEVNVVSLATSKGQAARNSKLRVKYGVYSPIVGLPPELSTTLSVHDTLEEAQSASHKLHLQAPRVSFLIYKVRPQK